MAIILKGAHLAKQIREDLKQSIIDLDVSPTLVIVQVGDDERSSLYIKKKVEFGEKIGAQVVHKQFSADVHEHEVVAYLDEVSADEAVDGVIVQLPLPAGWNAEELLKHVAPNKDVDCLTAENTARLYDGDPKFVPATARGVLSLLRHYDIAIAERKVTVIGRSALVGRPIAEILSQAGGLVTVCHSQTEDIKKEIRGADIVVSATGVKGLVTADAVHKDQTIIDVGINTEGIRVSGDVDFEAVEPIVKHITPVPGGVGPLTVASLFENLYEAHVKRKGIIPLSAGAI